MKSNVHRRPSWWTRWDMLPRLRLSREVASRLERKTQERLESPHRRELLAGHNWPHTRLQRELAGGLLPALRSFELFKVLEPML